MKKVAIFVEGQTERIFVTELLYQVYGYDKVEVIREKSRGKKRFVQLKAPKPFFDYYFLIVDVGEDSKVTSDMLENYDNMKKNDYSKILGLRDLYPQKREDKPKVLAAIQKIINQNNLSPQLCKVILAIMEVEAWFLADPDLFTQIDHRLTSQYILEKLQYDLRHDDPEIRYEHPAAAVGKIYELVGKQYRKRESDAYNIAKSINYNYLFLDVREQNKIASFFLFLSELETL